MYRVRAITRGGACVDMSVHGSSRRCDTGRFGGVTFVPRAGLHPVVPRPEKRRAGWACHKRFPNVIRRGQQREIQMQRIPGAHLNGSNVFWIHEYPFNVEELQFQPVVKRSNSSDPMRAYVCDSDAAGQCDSAVPSCELSHSEIADDQFTEIRLALPTAYYRVQFSQA